MRDETKCPQCGKPLERITYPGGYLNRDQWESVRAGDWWCESCPNNGRGRSGAYFWNREVATPLIPSEAGGRAEDFTLDDALRTFWQIPYGEHVPDAFRVSPTGQGLARVLARLASRSSGDGASPADSCAWVLSRLADDADASGREHIALTPAEARDVARRIAAMEAEQRRTVSKEVAARYIDAAVEAEFHAYAARDAALAELAKFRAARAAEGAKP